MITFADKVARAFIFSLFPLSLVAQKIYENQPIDYYHSKAVDQINTFFATPENVSNWRTHGRSGYLKSFLEAFDIPVESQVLVFSKTSLQSGLINPQTPRAIYFNDEIYVAWVPGGPILEISAPSPETGTNFYTISNEENMPQLLRETHDCLRCHGGSFTRDMPGHLVRSVFPAASGQPIFKAGTQLVDQSTPLEERWGGWFVTGSDLPHRGNLLYEETASGAEPFKRHSIDNVPKNGYLSRASDIVALMVLEHQTQAHTQLAGLVIQTRKAFHDQQIMDDLLKRNEQVSDSTRRRIKHAADKLIRCLFFAEEARIPEIDTENSAFAQVFQAKEPRDSRGRSLYQLAMHGRMFRFPLSYLIYSDSIAQLHPEARDYLWKEIERILDSPESEIGYEHLSQRDKRNIRAILKETHPRYRTNP